MRRITGYLLLILIILAPRVGAEIVRGRLDSQIFGQVYRYYAFLPEGYTEEKAYPVLYFLHGAGGSYRSWNQDGQFYRFTRQIDAIVVLPDGNGTSWYVDSPIRENSMWETFFLTEFLPEIDGQFSTIQAPEGRGLSGMSMGGYGAFYYAMKYPELFGAASAISGVLDLIGLHHTAGKEDVFGSVWTNRAFWEAHNPVQMADLLLKRETPLPLFFDMGTEDYVKATNDTFARRLDQLGIPYTYVTRSGGHTWAYWINNAKEHMEWLVEHLSKPVNR